MIGRILYPLSLSMHDSYRNYTTARYYANYLYEWKEGVTLHHSMTADMKNEYCDYFNSMGFGGVSPSWAEFIYGVTGVFDKRYIPDDIFNLFIDPIYPENRDNWQNKAYQSIFLPDVTFPDTIIKRINGYFYDRENHIISPERAVEILRDYRRVVIKPSVYTGGGIYISFFDTEELTADKLVNYSSFAPVRNDYIIQDKLIQSEFMARFNPTSVNTDKIMSFLFHGEVYIIGSFLRVGDDSSETDNLTFNEKGLFIGVKEDGTLTDIGYDRTKNNYTAFSDGTPFSSVKLDFHRKCCDIIRSAHIRLPYFPIISWDFAQREDGTPVLIEYNMKRHSVIEYQLFGHSLFGDLTDDVLREAAAEREKKNGFLCTYKKR